MLVFPGTTSPLVVKVIPAKAAELVPPAKAPGETLGAVTAAFDDTTELAGEPAGAPSLPRALATATGSDVRPGRMSAA